MYALHPAAVHFPIGLLLASSLFTLIAIWRDDHTWEHSAYHCLIVGWFGGLVAILTGTIDAYRQLTGPDAVGGSDVLNWVNAHAFSSIGAVLIYGSALLRRRRNPDLIAQSDQRRRYVLLHMIGSILIIGGSWLGGQLVYQLGLGIAQ